MKTETIKIKLPPPPIQAYTFHSLIKGHKDVPCNTFKEAFIQMHNWINDQLDSGGLARQILETAIWIETPTGPLYFYDALDLAYDMGIMKDGKLV